MFCGNVKFSFVLLWCSTLKRTISWFENELLLCVRCHANSMQNVKSVSLANDDIYDIESEIMKGKKKEKKNNNKRSVVWTSRSYRDLLQFAFEIIEIVSYREDVILLCSFLYAFLFVARRVLHFFFFSNANECDDSNTHHQ